MNGAPIDVGAVEVPTYFISTIEDHIAPWKSTYTGARLFSGPVRFVLGGSGHIAGIINPPAANKYGYWTNDALPADADDWFSAAEQHPGSWWTDWSRWVAKYAGPKVPARQPGAGKLPAIEDAPGSYVTLRADASGAPVPCMPALREPVAITAAATPVAAEGETLTRRQQRPDSVPEKPAAKAVKGALRAPRSKTKKT
jgi:hypothetical protein